MIEQPASYLLCGKQFHAMERKRWVSLTQSHRIIVRESLDSRHISRIIALVQDKHLVIFQDEMMIIKYIKVNTSLAVGGADDGAADVTDSLASYNNSDQHDTDHQRMQYLCFQVDDAPIIVSARKLQLSRLRISRFLAVGGMGRL